jgi:hypothetical protein
MAKNCGQTPWSNSAVEQVLSHSARNQFLAQIRNQRLISDLTVTNGYNGQIRPVFNRHNTVPMRLRSN